MNTIFMDTTISKIGKDNNSTGIDDNQKCFEEKINQYANENGEIDTEIALQLLTEVFKNA